MRWRRGPLENGVFSEIAEMANERQNCQIINKNSNEMAKGRGPLEVAILAKMAETANKRQNCQIINKNSNEMANGPFGKWPFWRKWRKRRLNAEIAKM